VKLAVRRTSAAIAAVATAGVSSIFFGAAPAFAATEACADGTLVAPGICEQTFTGPATFTPTSQMTQLEVLLVGAGGSSTDGQYTQPGYAGAAAGGGGEVKIVDFAGATAPLDVVVPTPGTSGSVTSGATVATVDNGDDGELDSQQGNERGARGGSSGSTTGPGNPGAFGSNSSATTPYAAGGGAGSAAPNNADGGAGVAVSTVAAGVPGSLFAGVGTCYGGGGAVGTSTVQGIPGCDAGRSDAAGTSLVAPRANSGGGAGAIEVTQTPSQRAGAAGVVVIRYTAANVTLAFSANGHGTAPASQSVVPGTAPTRPADPTATGFAFQGWYTDAQLTTLADFSAPITGSTTFYASWAPALAATGVTPTVEALPIGLAALAFGAGLVLVSRRRRTSN